MITTNKNRKKICAANWKLFKNPQEAQSFLTEWSSLVANITNSKALNFTDTAIVINNMAETVIFPPAYNLPTLSEFTKKNPEEKRRVSFGPQNIYFKNDGAFTGEISPLVVKEMGAKYALIGHSERRALFHENDEFISKKVKAAIDSGLVPMLCIGESLIEREKGETLNVLARQISAGLSLVATELVEKFEGASSSQFVPLVIAYEPVWAIGTGKVASVKEVREAHVAVRNFLEKTLSKEIATRTSILYGGSVKPDNAKELAAAQDVDGFLVGGASLKPKDFFAIYSVL